MGNCHPKTGEDYLRWCWHGENLGVASYNAICHNCWKWGIVPEDFGEQREESEIRFSEDTLSSSESLESEEHDAVGANPAVR